VPELEEGANVTPPAPAKGGKSQTPAAPPEEPTEETTLVAPPQAKPAKLYSGAQCILASKEIFGEPDWLVKVALKYAGLAHDKHHTREAVQAAIDSLKARKVER
jgi:hypothetical protein